MTQYDFILDSTKKISIVVPDLPDKFNYYYEPTEKLHRFDEATAQFINKDFCVMLKQDIIHEIIYPFNEYLKQAVNNQLILPPSVEVNKVGYALNYMLYNVANDLKKGVNISPFWAWSDLHHVQTLLYNSDDKIYLEIAPTYPWIYDEPKLEDNYISFDEFMGNYKPLVIEIIPKSTAIKWHKQCEAILVVLDQK